MSDSILKRFSSVFSAQLVMFVFGIMTTPLLVRVLGGSLYGNLAFIMSITEVLTRLVNAGILDGARKFIAEERKESKWKDYVFAFYFRTAVVLVLAASVGVCLFAYSGLARWYLGPQFVEYFYLVALLLLATQLFKTMRGVLLGLELERYSEPVMIVWRALYSILGVALAYIGLKVVGVLSGYILAAGVAATIGFVLVTRELDISTIIQPMPDWLPRRELLLFNYSSIWLSVFALSLYHVDVVLIQLFLSSERTGQYKAALVIAEFLWFVPSALDMVFLQSASELWSQDEHGSMTILSARATRYTFLLTSLMCIGVASLAAPLIRVYFGSGFSASVEPLLILLPGALAFAVALPAGTIIQGKGVLRPLVYANGAAAVLNFALNAILIPMYGITGAAIATSIGYGSILVLYIASARRVDFDPIADLRLLRVAGTAIPSGLLIYALPRAIDSDLLSLVVVPPIGFMIFFSLAIGLGALDIAELEPVTKRFRRFSFAR